MKKAGPKKTKFPKYQKGNLKNKIVSNPAFLKKVSFGRVSLVSLESGRIPWEQFELFRFRLSKNLKRTCQIKLKFFAHWPITSKPLEVRMGKGKGAQSDWIAKMQTGSKLVEIEGENIYKIRATLERIQNKLSVKTKILYE